MRACGGSRRKMASALTDFPEPDSPPVPALRPARPESSHRGQRLHFPERWRIQRRDFGPQAAETHRYRNSPPIRAERPAVVRFEFSLEKSKFMPLSWNEIRARAARFAEEWKNARTRRGKHRPFITSSLT